MPGYDFTRDFFSPCIPFWQEHLAPFVGRPGVRYLEVGVFEGRSFTWMIDHVLTAPDARATAVDVFYPSADYEARFRRNVALTGMAGRVEILNGPSAELLRGFPPASFDLVYVDGSHSPGPVFCDLANAWVTLSPGGVMILDDYELHPGLGVWATLERATGALVGMHLLNHMFGESHIQVGYVLATEFWGRGYASEMCRAVLRYGFGALGLPRIVAITDRDNLGSQRVLLKCGLQRHGERAFAHPKYASGPYAWFFRDADAWLADDAQGKTSPST